MFPEEEEEELIDLEEKPEKEGEKVVPKSETVGITIGQLEAKIPADFELFYRAKKTVTGYLFEPFTMKRVTDFSVEEEWKDKQKNPLKLVPVVSVVINILVVCIFAFFGNPLPFVFLLSLNALFVLAFFLAGENFWLWLFYWFQRTKNWGFKFLSSLSGQDELHFGKLTEKHDFKYVDEAGKKRIAPVSTRKIRYLSNLRAGYVIYREGIPDSIDLHEEYPTARLNRDTNQSILGGVQSGYLLAMDELVALLKKRGQDMLMILMLGLVIILLIISIYFAYKNPETTAYALKEALAAATSGGVINVPPAGG